MEDGDALFRALARQVKAGEIALELDWKRLRHMDSPVAVEAETTRWAYGVMALTFLALWRLGWPAALGVLGAGAALFYTLGLAQIRRRIRRRIDERALGGLDEWQKLWRFGGVALVAKDGEICVAPGGNWMALARKAST